jgi:hypothetical protein
MTIVPKNPAVEELDEQETNAIISLADSSYSKSGSC